MGNHHGNHRFDKSLRLLNSKQFNTVFDRVDHKAYTNYFTCLARKNACDKPRIGFIIAKKKVKRAIDRNTIKRVFRESFRLNQAHLPPCDLIILIKKPFSVISKSLLHQQSEQLWERVIRNASQ